MVEKLQLLGGRIHPLAVHQQLVGVQVDDQLIKDQALLGLLLLAEAAEHRVDAGQYLFHLEGLGDVVVRPHLQAGDLVLQLTLGGEHDDGHLGAFPDLFADGPAVHAGEHDVQQHQLGLELLKFLQTHQPVSRRLAVHALLFQIEPEQVGNIFIVLYDQYLPGHTRTPFR